MLFEFSSQLQVTSRLRGRIGEAPVKLGGYFLELFVRVPSGIEDRIIHTVTPEPLPRQVNSQFTGQMRQEYSDVLPPMFPQPPESGWH